NLTLLNRYDFLGRFFSLTIVNILSNIMVPLAGSISVAFLGHLTDIHQLVGVTLATILFDGIYWVLNFLRTGTTGMTAQAVGRDDREGVLLVGLRNGFIALGIGLLILILQSPLHRLGFALMNATPEVKAIGIAYFNVRIWGFPAALLNMVLMGWLLGREKSTQVLLMSLIGNGANILLSYITIIQWNWASTGAGFSQAFSDYLMLFVGLILVSREMLLPKIRVVAEQLWKTSEFKATLTLNANLFVRSLIIAFIFATFTSLGAAMGSSIQAENALILQVLLLAQFFCQGVGFATETLVGNFKGKKAQEQFLPLLQIALSTNLVIGLTFSVVSILFTESIFGLFTNHADIIAEITIYVPWLLSIIGFSTIALLLEGYFAALAEGKVLRNSVLAGAFLGFTPIAVLTWYFHSNHMLWLAMAMFGVVRAVTIGIQVPRTLENNLETVSPFGEVKSQKSKVRNKGLLPS
ncbi:MAG: guanitoxin biosynthesis MATE family efflux transporter GntT, partial [Scytonema sp. PMC 1069.18]|nr:guanitoxin biosynthesis MATE family efflux transporter GntT [Scytonema sp. PMC 1069.18]